MKKIIKKEKVNNRGAPNKADAKKINAYHVRNEQWDWIVDEAEIRNMSPFAYMREALDTVKTMLDKARADSKTFEMFDKEGLSVKANDGK